MSEREFWLLIRRALLMVCRAIEKRYNIGEKDEAACPVNNGSAKEETA